MFKYSYLESLPKLFKNHLIVHAKIKTKILTTARNIAEAIKRIVLLLNRLFTRSLSEQSLKCLRDDVALRSEVRNNKSR